MTKKNFEEAMQRLEEIVKQLEEGDLSLDASLKIFEEGMELIKFCTLKLEEAEKKVTMLLEQDNGDTVQVPFNP
jgi:exodeoxyribonuclease VII small subunit